MGSGSQQAPKTGSKGQSNKRQDRKHQNNAHMKYSDVKLTPFFILFPFSEYILDIPLANIAGFNPDT